MPNDGVELVSDPSSLAQSGKSSLLGISSRDLLRPGDDEAEYQDDGYKLEAIDSDHPQKRGTDEPEEFAWKPWCGGVPRLIVVLSLHCLGFMVINTLIVLFVRNGNYGIVTVLVLPLLLSGVLCTSAAWHSRTPLLDEWLGCSFLPVREKHMCVQLPLVLLFGLGQIVVLALELEAHFARRANQNTVGRGRIKTSLYHCKAVTGSIEGVIASAVVLYSYWGMDFPPGDPIFDNILKDFTTDAKAKKYYHHLLMCLCSFPFMSAGLGIMQLDFVISPRVQRRIQTLFGYEFLHWTFRSCEITSRIALHMTFCVLTRKTRQWVWFLPCWIDFLTSVFLVNLYGGCENTFFVLLLISIPCCFCDVFRFVDSKNKRRAARKLSHALSLRNILELVLLPLWAHFVVDDRLSWKLLSSHWWSASLAFLPIPLYWIFLWLVTADTLYEEEEMDIFTACESGDIEAVRALTTDTPVGTDLNVFDVDGKSPLMCLVVRRYRKREIALGETDTLRQKDAEICRLLIEEGARVDLKMFEDGRLVMRKIWLPMRRRWTALHMAAWKGNHIVVAALADPELHAEHSLDLGDYADAVGDTPLHIAVSYGHLKVAEALLGSWPNWVSIQNLKGNTPATLARDEKMKNLLQRYAVSSGQPAALLKKRGSIQNRRASVREQGPQFDWVKLPIVFTFSDARGTCSAPGLSSYVVSCGTGALGRIFLSETTGDTNTKFPARLGIIGEDEEMPSETLPMPQSNQQSSFGVKRSSKEREHVGISSICVERPARGGDSGSSASMRVSWSQSPLADGLEPIDTHGRTPKQWAEMLNEYADRRSKSLGAERFQKMPPECILGVGAYGQVWRARDRRTGTKYAVKHIKMRSSPSPAERECEMSDHIRLQPHPCIVHLFAVHCFPELSFYMIVMELCANGDLQGEIRRLRRVASELARDYKPPSNAGRWGAQIFLGLEHLHVSTNALLRDLKPGNVVISAHGIAKLTDFGLGCVVKESTGAWTFGMPPGSPGYISPECLLQQRYDTSSDLYSYGVLLFVLFSGGVTYKQDPQPPMAKTRKGDFLVHAEDWQLLQRCLYEPEAHFAPPLEENTLNLVAKLVQRRPDKRPSHAEIRQHELLIEAEVPEQKATPEQVQAWLGSCSERFRNSATTA